MNRRIPWGEIMRRRADGESSQALAREYGIPANTIYKHVGDVDAPRATRGRGVRMVGVDPEPCPRCGFAYQLTTHGCAPEHISTIIDRVLPTIGGR